MEEAASDTIGSYLSRALESRATEQRKCPFLSITALPRPPAPALAASELSVEDWFC